MPKKASLIVSSIFLGILFLNTISIPVKSKKIIIVEGMCSIYEKVQDIFDIKIYIDLDEEEINKIKEKLNQKINKEIIITPKKQRDSYLEFLCFSLHFLYFNNASIASSTE